MKINRVAWLEYVRGVYNETGDFERRDHVNDLLNQWIAELKLPIVPLLQEEAEVDQLQVWNELLQVDHEIENHPILEQMDESLAEQVHTALLAKDMSSLAQITKQAPKSAFYSRARLAASMALFDMSMVDNCVPLWESAWGLDAALKQAIIDAYVRVVLRQSEDLSLFNNMPYGQQIQERILVGSGKQLQTPSADDRVQACLDIKNGKPDLAMSSLCEEEKERMRILRNHCPKQRGINVRVVQTHWSNLYNLPTCRKPNNAVSAIQPLFNQGNTPAAVTDAFTLGRETGKMEMRLRGPAKATGNGIYAAMPLNRAMIRVLEQFQQGLTAIDQAAHDLEPISLHGTLEGDVKNSSDGPVLPGALPVPSTVPKAQEPASINDPATIDRGNKEGTAYGNPRPKPKPQMPNLTPGAGAVQPSSAPVLSTPVSPAQSTPSLSDPSSSEVLSPHHPISFAELDQDLTTKASATAGQTVGDVLKPVERVTKQIVKHASGQDPAAPLSTQSFQDRMAMQLDHLFRLQEWILSLRQLRSNVQGFKSQNQSFLRHLQYLEDRHVEMQKVLAANPGIDRKGQAQEELNQFNNLIREKYGPKLEAERQMAMKAQQSC